LKEHRVSDVRQREICTTETLVSVLIPPEFEVTSLNLKNYTSQGNHQIPVIMIQIIGETLLFEIHKLIKTIWNKRNLPDQWKESIHVPICKKGDKTDCNNN
jgi:hypothetical protein